MGSSTGVVKVEAAGYSVAAYSAATGTRLWRTHFGEGNTSDATVSMAVSPLGRTVFVTGASVAADAGSAVFETIAFDVVTGTARWTSHYTGPSSRSEPTSIAASPTGNTVFVTGASDVPGLGDDYATVAYNAFTGAQRWVTRYNGGGVITDFSHSIVVSAGGRVYVMYSIGLQENTGPGNHDALAAYDAATGAPIWSKRYAMGFARAIGVSPDGARAFVTGAGTIAYRGATGARLWARRDGGLSLAVSPTGNEVAIASDVSFDYATFAYKAATGARLWARRYDGPGHQDDSPFSVSFGPAGGRVFVTGRSVGRGSDDDYATIAYKN